MNSQKAKFDQHWKGLTDSQPWLWSCSQWYRNQGLSFQPFLSEENCSVWAVIVDDELKLRLNHKKVVKSKVQCLCPCFADTAIIDDKDGGSTFRRSLENSIGILSVSIFRTKLNKDFRRSLENSIGILSVSIFRFFVRFSSLKLNQRIIKQL